MSFPQCGRGGAGVAKKRNGQTNPTLRKINAARENGRVLPQSGHGWSKRFAISGQLSEVSDWRSAIGDRRSALSCQLSAVGRRRGSQVHLYWRRGGTVGGSRVPLLLSPPRRACESSAQEQCSRVHCSRAVAYWHAGACSAALFKSCRAASRVGKGLGGLARRQV